MLKNCFNFYTLLATLIMLISTIAIADVVDDAYRLCGAMEATGLTTECEVRGFGSTVDVTVDTNRSEARQICAGVTDMMAKKHKLSQVNGNYESFLHIVARNLSLYVHLNNVLYTIKPTTVT